MFRPRLGTDDSRMVLGPPAHQFDHKIEVLVLALKIKEVKPSFLCHSHLLIPQL
jgi:hypothetical protein